MLFYAAGETLDKTKVQVPEYLQELNNIDKVRMYELK